MEGLVADAMLATAAHGPYKVRDTALNMEAQSLQQYEIAKYGCLRNLAEAVVDAESREILKKFCSMKRK